jgi:hypothetical protein
VSAKRVNGYEAEAEEVIALAETWLGSREQAETWFRTVPISAFGCRTAKQIVFMGNGVAAKAYVEHLATGGYA